MKHLIIKTLIVFFIISFFNTLSAQVVYEHVSHTGIYEFLDELANNNIIELNTAVKPYSRKLIAEKLDDAYAKKSELNNRQTEDLIFYITEFQNESHTKITPKIAPLFEKNNLSLSWRNPSLNYRDSTFVFNLKPIAARRYYINNNGTMYDNYWGASFFGYGSGKIGFYGSLMDHYLKSFILSMPEYLTQEPGGNYKINEGERAGGDYSEMRGGITYNYKWLTLGLKKDHVVWGTNYHGSNILSGRTPSFPMVSIKASPAKWLDFNYFHAWLVSEVVDSARSYYTSNGEYRPVFFDKYMAANFFTITPVKKISVSIGNSIVYSDVNANPAYFIPVMFYKSIDHTLNHSNTENQNSQMFIDISVRKIRHLHLYGSYYIDEFSINRITDPETRNFTSGKLGFVLSNWPLKNVAIVSEYTQSNPLVFKHRVPSATFESNKFNLGHYLIDNAREIYAMASFKPYRGLTLKGSINLAQKGNDYPYRFIPGQPRSLVERNPFMKDVIWQNTSIGLSVNWEFAYNCYAYMGYQYNNIQCSDADGNTADYYMKKFTSPLYYGKTHTMSFGMHFGF